MKKIKYIIFITIFALICYGFSLVMIFAPSKSFSMSERRALAKCPAPSGTTLLSGKFMNDFDAFTMDQFPLRDSFRAVKANFVKYVLFQKDNNGLYLQNGYLSKIDFNASSEKIKKNTAKLNAIYKESLENSDCKIYLSIIPDKNYFLAPQGNIPTMDYDYLVSETKSQLEYATYIDIFPLLSLENFYRTDQHWKQETILPVAQTLAFGMQGQITEGLYPVEIDTPFYGSYYGQAALKVQPDKIIYMNSPILENATVTSYNTGTAKPSKMYDTSKATDRDPYEMFLSGSDALLTIENPAANENRELVIFRDSFGSSITPLLIQSYSKITLVDLRYIQPAMVKKFVDFTNQDVLILYSTMVLNN